MATDASGAARICAHVVYHGRVQGVGFRYTCQNLAADMPIGGFVRNLPDGTVELQADGPADAVRELLSAIDVQFAGNIRRKDVREQPSSGARPPLRIAY